MINRVTIRKEEPKDYYQTEHMTQRAFWNKYRPGCDEHYLVHKLRSDPAYLPAISRVAVMDGAVIGCIMYSKASVTDGEKQYKVATFGPLCVDPDYQGRRIGARLVKETLKLAEAAGIPGIIIYGEPDYYPRLGFLTCDHFGITTPKGENFDAFMGYELKKNSFKNIRGKFYEAEVFHCLPESEINNFNKKFPVMKEVKGGPEQCCRRNLF